jgi:hypothetical protein
LYAMLCFFKITNIQKCNIVRIRSTENTLGAWQSRTLLPNNGHTLGQLIFNSFKM